MTLRAYNSHIYSEIEGLGDQWVGKTWGKNNGNKHPNVAAIKQGIINEAIHDINN